MAPVATALRTESPSGLRARRLDRAEITPVTRTDHCATVGLRRRRTTASAEPKTSNEATTAATTMG